MQTTSVIALKNPYANSKLKGVKDFNTFGRDTLTLDEIAPTLRQLREHDEARDT